MKMFLSSPHYLWINKLFPNKKKVTFTIKIIDKLCHKQD